MSEYDKERDPLNIIGDHDRAIDLRPATEPRTEAGRQLLDRQQMKRPYRDLLKEDILAIEAEAAQGAILSERWVERTVGEPGMYDDDDEGAAPRPDCECGSCEDVRAQGAATLNIEADFQRFLHPKGTVPRAEECHRFRHDEHCDHD